MRLIPSWTTFAGALQSPLFRIAGAMVFLAPGIHLLLTHLPPEESFVVRFRLWLVAFGLLATSAFIYYRWCPELIRKYSPYQKFVRVGQSTSYLLDTLRHALCEERVLRADSVASWLAEFGHRAGLGTGLHILAEQANKTYIEQRLKHVELEPGRSGTAHHMVVGLVDRTVPAARATAAALSSCGILLAGLIEVANLVILVANVDLIEELVKWMRS